MQSEHERVAHFFRHSLPTIEFSPQSSAPERMADLWNSLPFATLTAGCANYRSDVCAAKTFMMNPLFGSAGIRARSIERSCSGTS